MPHRTICALALLLIGSSAFAQGRAYVTTADFDSANFLHNTDGVPGASDGNLPNALA